MIGYCFKPLCSMFLLCGHEYTTKLLNFFGLISCTLAAAYRLLCLFCIHWTKKLSIKLCSLVSNERTNLKVVVFQYFKERIAYVISYVAANLLIYPIGVVLSLLSIKGLKACTLYKVIHLRVLHDV